MGRLRTAAWLALGLGMLIAIQGGLPEADPEGTPGADTPDQAATTASDTDREGAIQRPLRRLIQRTENGAGLPTAAGAIRGIRAFGYARVADRIRIVVEARGPDAVPAVRERIAQKGGRVEATAGPRLQALLSPSKIDALAERANVRFVRLPVRPLPPRRELAQQAESGEIRSEGLSVMALQRWREVALAGQGVTVGIIDSGFRDYDKLLGEELPGKRRVATESFTSAGIECANCPRVNRVHGLAVAEIVHDVAPRSNLILSNFGTGVEFQRAVRHMVQEKVDVLNTSLGFPSGCFGRDAGVFADTIREARQAGITWTSSAGNEAGVHWQGEWRDPDGDDRHNFREEANSFQLEVELVDGSEVRGARDEAAVAVLSATLSWNGDCGDAAGDFRLEIVPEGDPERRVTSDWAWRPGIPIQIAGQAFTYDASQVGERRTFRIVVEKSSGAEADEARLDLLINECRRCVGGDGDLLTEKGSVSILEPSISPHVITVGAAHHDPEACGELCPQDALLVYSSQGPTKDGRTKPDIAAPTHVSTSAFGPWDRTGEDPRLGFTGTSAASPHAAGAAALLQQALPEAGPDAIEEELTSRAEDFGPPGEDNRFGAGMLTLGPLPFDASQPHVTGLAPDRVTVGATTEARITGTSLDEATDVVVAGKGVAAEITERVSSRELAVTFRAAVDAEPGRRPFRVITPDGEAPSGRVALQVRGRPRLAVEPDEIELEATVGRTSPLRETIRVRNQGDGALAWQARSNKDWLVPRPESGERAGFLSIEADPSGLGPGVHRAAVTIDAPNALNSPVTVPVRLAIRVPRIGVEPARLEFALTAGESPPDKTLTIRNTGGGRLRWTAEPTVPWLALGVTEGTGSVSVRVSLQTDALAPGVHEGAIRIRPDNGRTDPVTVPVRARVQGRNRLVALRFVRLAFVTPDHWQRILGEGCVVYRNLHDDYSAVRITPVESDERKTFHVPSRNDVWVCGSVVHIDTRGDVPNR